MSDSSRWLRVSLMLWVIILIILSRISLEPGLYDSLRILVIGLGAILLVYMAGLRIIIGLGLFIYLIVASIIAYNIASAKNGLSYLESIAFLAPVLIVAVYAWLKRPKP